MSPIFKSKHVLVILAGLLFSYTNLQSREVVNNNGNGGCVSCNDFAAGTTTPKFDRSIDACPGQNVAAEVSDMPDPDKVEEEAPGPCKSYFELRFSDSLFQITNRIRFEGLYGQNLRFLNDINNAFTPELDKTIFPGRHTLDSWFLYTYGRQSKGYDIVKARLGLRNRGIWGDEASILPTSEQTIRHVDAVIGDHAHSITRHIFWARELWVEWVLNDICGFNSPAKHTLTAGIFPFSVGRGISLGDAYEVDPDFIGFFTTSAIDQFAPGFKLSGELIVPCVLSYDIYVEIADNLSGTFNLVNQPINGQRRGRRFDPARGFGILDYIVAGRFLWNPYKEKEKKVQIEPYVLYFEDREQKINFLGDARLKLGTVGLAGEFCYGKFEAGFEGAMNFGNQKVFAWDKNIVKEENRDGFDAFVFDKVKVGSPTGPNVLKTKESSAIVDRSTFCAACNGRQIGVLADGTPLFNALNRFNDERDNGVFAGMFVYDMAYNLSSSMQFAATAGFATGDENPNQFLTSFDDELGVETFNGFVGLQELYSGKRVRSLYLLAGKGDPPRLLSVPSENVDEFPTRVRRFTNLILTGGAFKATPMINNVPVEFNSNILAYWSWASPRIFRQPPGCDEIDPIDCIGRLERIGSTFLGVEWNFIVEAEIFKDLRAIGNVAFFFPGTFYRDLTGIPMSRDERDFLDSIATPNSDAPVRRVPIIGNDPGWFLYGALEYKF